MTNLKARIEALRDELRVTAKAEFIKQPILGGPADAYSRCVFKLTAILEDTSDPWVDPGILYTANGAPVGQPSDAQLATWRWDDLDRLEKTIRRARDLKTDGACHGCGDVVQHAKPNSTCVASTDCAERVVAPCDHQWIKHTGIDTESDELVDVLVCWRCLENRRVGSDSPESKP